MGAGKSRAAQTAAGANAEAIDTDALLEQDLGMPIAEFFEREGEPEFRRREERLVVQTLANARGAPVALGGGSVLSAGVRDALAAHVVVLLEVGAAEAWGRVEGSPRPLASDRDAFEALLTERQPLYDELADAIIPARREVVKRCLPVLEAMRELPAKTRMAWARSASGEYPALVGRGILGADPLARISARGGLEALAGRRYGISDTAVAARYGDSVGELEALIEIPPGEQAKTVGEAERVLRELARHGVTRADHVLALGGGVVGDLAGFCAATYQRGVPVVQVPTTLVAQVDSAYGGKTGVDLPEAKNYVGAYHQPAAVLADPDTLATLPAAELAAGFVEVLKTGLIAGGRLWDEARALDRLEPGALEGVIFACARTKLSVVASDERDSGRRQVLNLGHTVGHAIETATGYGRYRHGEAVGLGLLAALRLSDAVQLRGEVADVLARHGLPTSLAADAAVDDVLAALERDKKRTAEGVPFVLCPEPGNAVTGQLVEASRVREAVEELYADNR
jgi:shikimate kinase/3-dehydroquinate synthase